MGQIPAPARCWRSLDRLAVRPGSCHDSRVNQESLERANAFLAAVASRVGPGEALEVSPADIARDMGLPEPLAAARAVRALLARRRLEMVDGTLQMPSEGQS